MHVCVCLWRTNERRAQCIHTRVCACLYVCMYCIDYDYKFNWMPPERSRNGHPIGRAGAREHAYALVLSLSVYRTRDWETKWKRSELAINRPSARSIPFRERDGTQAQANERSLALSAECRLVSSLCRVVFDVMRESFLFPIGVPCASGDCGGRQWCASVRLILLLLPLHRSVLNI